VPRLELPAALVARLREVLLREDGDERFAFLYVGESNEGLLGSRVVPVPDGRMAEQARTACRPDPAVERERVAECVAEQLAPVFVHSHPFSAEPAFSGLDVEAMGKFRQWLDGLFDDQAYGFAVLGTEGVEALADAGGRYESLDVEVVGGWTLEEPLVGATSRFALDEDDADDGPEVDEARYDRNVRALSVDGQRRLADVTVGVVGVGGLGSLVAEQLVRLGVEDLVLVDAVRAHCWKAGGDVDVDAHYDRVEDRPSVLDRCDVVVGCVDRVATRSFLNEYAVRHLAYYVDAGVRIGVDGDDLQAMRGYVQLVAPGANGCFDCLGRHDAAAARVERMDDDERESAVDRGYVEEGEFAPEPAVVHLNGTTASKTVSVVSALVTGAAEPPDFVRYEDLGHEMTALSTERSEHCPTCGEEGVLGVGRREFGDVDTDPGVPDEQLPDPARAETTDD
jgi:molybdopterin/thiamine biosynthesis adenylyltransferase